MADLFIPQPAPQPLGMAPGPGRYVSQPMPAAMTQQPMPQTVPHPGQALGIANPQIQDTVKAMLAAQQQGGLTAVAGQNPAAPSLGATPPPQMMSAPQQMASLAAAPPQSYLTANPGGGYTAAPGWLQDTPGGGLSVQGWTGAQPDLMSWDRIGGDDAKIRAFMQANNITVDPAAVQAHSDAAFGPSGVQRYSRPAPPSQAMQRQSRLQQARGRYGFGYANRY